MFVTVFAVQVDVDTYRLHVEGDGMRTVNLTLDALKTIFKKHTITATIQCAGGAVRGFQGQTPGLYLFFFTYFFYTHLK